MDKTQSPDIAALYAQVPERNTSDVILRTAQQHHVALSTMADTKANIIITVSSIVLTLSIGKLDQPELRASVLLLTFFTLLALLLAILAVLPKYRPIRLTTIELPPGFNLLFFGHFAELSRDRYLAEIARTLKPDGSIYAAMAKDIYSLGFYLSHHKYRYLRLSYLSFLTGFILASLMQLWHLVAR
jgi:pycsar effector protein